MTAYDARDSHEDERIAREGGQRDEEHVERTFASRFVERRRKLRGKVSCGFHNPVVVHARLRQQRTSRRSV